jgi:hypothetical protein
VALETNFLFGPERINFKVTIKPGLNSFKFRIKTHEVIEIYKLTGFLDFADMIFQLESGGLWELFLE